MNLYTFYPTRPDGLAPTMSMIELENDAAAFMEAVQLLEEHASAESIVVWQGPRRVLACLRANDVDPRLA
jgi:hypothetical protein